MNILILGCGNAGVRLAKLLDERGHDVSVIDNSPKNLENLGDGFSGLSALGEIFDIAALKSVGADNADAAVVLTHDDNANIMASQVLRKYFGAERIYTRILDPEKEEAFSGRGFETLCPTGFEVSRMYDLVMAEDDNEESFEIFGRNSCFEILETERSDFGKTPSELELLEGEMVFGVKKKGGKLLLANAPGLTIEKGDKVILVR